MIDAISALSGFSLGGVGAPTGTATRAAGIGPTSLGSTMATGAVETRDFGAVLADMAASGAQTMRTGEAAAIAGMQGSASVQDVVQAVMSAEQTLQTALAVRDKVVAAYQDISRMAI